MGERDSDIAAVRVLVIVPAYNEAESIATAMADLRAHAPWADVVVVDDGSADDTRRIARRLGAAVLGLPCNLGVGGAMQTGYIYAHRWGYDIAVQFDADAQHRANQIAKLCGPVLAGEAELTVGSRILSRRKFAFGPLRFIGSRLLALLVSAIVRRRITDPTSGFRAASRKMIAFFAAHYPQTYLADTTEALVWAARSGMRIREVPIRMRKRKAGLATTGAIRGLGHTLRIVLALLVDCLEEPIDKSETDK